MPLLSISRGITNREAGYKKHSACATSSEESSTTDHCVDNLSLENVHTLTTFQLRQELKRRGYFLEPQVEGIYYRVLLEKMVSILRHEKENAEQQHLENLMICGSGGSGGNGNQTSLEDKLRKEKERRKVEAIKRSRERQRNKNYFQLKRDANESHASNNSKNIANEEAPTFADTKPSPSCTLKNANVHRGDPFARTFRSKIGGKCS